MSLIVCGMLLLAEHRLTTHSLVKIDLMGIKFGSINARKEGLATNTHAAGSAHTRTIDHQCIERHGGFERVWPYGSGCY